MGGAGTSPPPRRPAATRGAVGARGAYVTCQVSIQVCFEIYSRFETQMFVSSGEVRDLILESLCHGARVEALVAILRRFRHFRGIAHRCFVILAMACAWHACESQNMHPNMENVHRVL